MRVDFSNAEKWQEFFENIFVVRGGQHFAIRDKFLFKTVFQ